MDDLHAWSIVAVVALVTALIRFLPFIVFGKGRKIPAIIEKLGRVLPYAIMGMLVVYCIKDISFKQMSGYMPTVISCAAVVVLHIWRRNTLISIVGGTVCHMMLIQLVF